jgi:hypothetical protein
MKSILSKAPRLACRSEEGRLTLWQFLHVVRDNTLQIRRRRLSNRYPAVLAIALAISAGNVAGADDEVPCFLGTNNDTGFYRWVNKCHGTVRIDWVRTYEKQTGWNKHETATKEDHWTAEACTLGERQLESGQYKFKVSASPEVASTTCITIKK